MSCMARKLLATQKKINHLPDDVIHEAIEIFK